ncbi:MAG: DUF1844 domain-containing protein [Planctomycetota bacterium]
MSDDKPEIFVDDDFKSQVAAEKEALKQAAAETEASTADDPTADPSMQLPEASFGLLISMFVSEAMAAMGQMPNPMTNEMTINLDHASYAIDMLAMLKDKTKGNLTDAEDTALIDVLHQLRMAFIAVKQAPHQPSVTQPPASP